MRVVVVRCRRRQALMQPATRTGCCLLHPTATEPPRTAADSRPMVEVGKGWQGGSTSLHSLGNVLCMQTPVCEVRCNKMQYRAGNLRVHRRSTPAHTEETGTDTVMHDECECVSKMRYNTYGTYTPRANLFRKQEVKRNIVSQAKHVKERKTKTMRDQPSL